MTILWSPAGRDSTMRRFAQRNGFDDYEALQRWSVTDLDGFWRAVADHFGVHLEGEVLRSREMPGAQWFPDATINYAAHALPEIDDVAVVARSQSRAPLTWTFKDL